MAKPAFIELPGVEPIPILYEDRSALAVDKPRGWLIVPVRWQHTGRNLQAALISSIAAGDFWARARGLKFLRFVHRLDAETSGVLLAVRNRGALPAYSALFAQRQVEKTYLAVVVGAPPQKEWTCHLRVAPDPRCRGRMRVDRRHGQEAQTRLRCLQTRGERSLLEVRPLTGRTHQIRVHLAACGCPVIGDALYGRADARLALGLRAVRLAYSDPFTHRRVEIRAPCEQFCRAYGFDTPEL